MGRRRQKPAPRVPGMMLGARQQAHAGLGLLVGGLLVLPGPALGQRTLPLSCDAAQARFLSVSDALAAADAGVRAREAQVEATRTLGRPDVDVEAQALEFQKTLFLSAGSLAPVTAAFGIPDPLRLRTRRFVSRPIVTATLPIYAGGQLDAARAGAAAQLGVEEASRDGAMSEGLEQLAQAYFGRQLAARALDVRRAAVAAIARHVADAQALEREQQIAPAQRLQAEASLEQARREAEKAEAELSAADAGLSGLLRTDQIVEPTTSFEALPSTLPPASIFVAAALDGHPTLRRLEATGELAKAGVRTEQAKLRPNVYAIAQYNLDRRDTLVTDPDFIFGVGVKYRLLSGLGRQSQVTAARELVTQAEAGAREARTQLEIGVAIAWTRADSARRRHALYDRSIAAADESLRVAKLSFRELQGTSRDVVDAELSVARARLEREQAAYDYVMALVQLLSASGRMAELPAYLPAVAGRRP